MKQIVMVDSSGILGTGQVEAIEEKSRERYKNLPQEEKDKIKEYQRKKYQELVQYKKEALKNK